MTTPKPEELKALLLIELAERFERGEIIGATQYSLRCADALRWAYGNTLSRPEPASVPGDAREIGREIVAKMDADPCIYSSGVAGQIMALPAVYQDAIRFVSSNEFRALLAVVPLK